MFTIQQDSCYEGCPTYLCRQMSNIISIEATFCFVDIAGYTALTDSHGDVAAADLVDDFCNLVRESIIPHGQFQSLIGDCAFLLFPNPIAATHALVRLYKLIADRHSFPIVRAGLHHGSALLRDHHHVGTAVNIAARIAAQATGGGRSCARIAWRIACIQPIWLTFQFYTKAQCS
jgi:adenylate cyclase